MLRWRWPQLGRARLLGLVFAAQGLGGAALHDWSARPSAHQEAAQLALFAQEAPPTPRGAEAPPLTPTEARPEHLVSRGSVGDGQDVRAAAWLAVQESFLEPDPTSLGIVDYFGSQRQSKERLKVHARHPKFMVPWWGWLVFASILVVLAAISFGLGTVCTARGKQAESSGSLASAAGVGALATSSASARRKSKETASRSGSKEDAADSPVGDSGGTLATRARSRPAQSTSRCLPCLSDQCGSLFGRAVRSAVAMIDKKVIGVGLHFSDLRVNVRTGIVELDNVVLDNPEGYKSEYLLSIGRVHVQVSMAKFIFSRGKTVVVESIEVTGVEIIYEKALTTSNFEYVLDFAKPAAEKDDSSTLTRTLIGTIGEGSSMAATAVGSVAGRLQGVVVGEDDEGGGTMLRTASMGVQSVAQGVQSAAEATMVGRMVGTVGQAVASTAADVVDHTAGIVGTTAAIGTTAVSLTAETVEKQLASAAMGTISGARSAVSTAVTTVGGASSSSNAPAPQAAEEPDEPKPKVTVIIKKLAICGIGVTVASNFVGGRGVRLACSNIEYDDFTGSMNLVGGISIVKILLKTLLLNAVKSLSTIGGFTIETTGRAVGLGRTFAQEVEGSAVSALQLV